MSEQPMEILYNSSSQPVCWLDGNTAFSRDGRPQAFVDRGAVFSADGCYLGRFAHGVFRDRLGCIVAFPRNVWWSRVPASFQSSWTPPPIQAGAIPMFTLHEAHPACPVMPSLRSSTLTWKQYLRGCAAKQFLRTRR